MKKQDVMIWDWYRVLFGETPVIFLVEILLRTILMYAVLLVIVRMMGKRMGGQLTISEMAVMITLGAIVSPGMQMPQTGLLLCATILVCALVFQRGMNFLEYRSEKFEQITQGKLSILVKNGVIQLDEMKETNISRQQLFAKLRSEGVYNLGEVDRVYLESCGLFSVFKNEKALPGLSVFPPVDEAIGRYLQQDDSAQNVCASCGTVASTVNSKDNCAACGAHQWQIASTSQKEQSK
ncbi:DUF421 domain-containing protein [Dyadobacter luticola]|uniref:DUF421 domain-containing protein n=1 Tax=Dyadobacter luticola TaxID=1979387 RepID=A0A5R9KZI2_9BACT|nr:YetF domain-containing protein [Dyadobacter luticola]TLV01497.1 DUF421 domain-containing protein [Dyadobacter luticola]